MNKLVDVLGFAFVVAAIMVLTRPGSQGPSFVTAIGNGFSNIIKAATGGGPYHAPR